MNEPAPDKFWDRLWEGWTHWIGTQRGGTSQEALARKMTELSGLRVRQEDISRWLKARGRPSFEELPFLAQALGVRRDWLAFNDGEMVEAGAVEKTLKKTPQHRVTAGGEPTPGTKRKRA